MKNLFKSIAIFSLSLLTVGVMAQGVAVSTPTMHRTTIQQNHLKGIMHPAHRLGVALPAQYALDYDSADASNWGGSYANYQGEVMNKYYKIADSTGSYLLSQYSQNYDIIRYVTVAFDSLFDPFAFASQSTYNVNNMTVDTIYVPIVQVNNSGMVDTLTISLNTVAADGYPTSTMIKDTMIIGTTLGGGSDNAIVFYSWGVNKNLLTGKFSVRVTYSDLSKLDTCWFIYGFGYFSGNCQGSGPYTLAEPSTFSEIHAATPWTANSFIYYGIDEKQFPSSTDSILFYDCNSDGMFTAGTDGAAYQQDVLVEALVQVNDTAAGVAKTVSNGLYVGQNYPNPFSTQTTISYSLTKTSDVIFTVYDITGRIIANNNYGSVASGQHTINLSANTFSPGIYFYTFNVNGSTVTKKMVITE